MKKTSTIILTVIACTFLSSSPSKVFSQTNAKKPSWITKAPTAKNTYIGIASVSKRSMNPDGEPAGYAGYYAVLDEGYITNVAVREVFRRRHIADRLMEELEHRAKEDGLAFLTLEVRESNAPAVALYSKHGFETRGLRKNYYERPRENALIMTLDLI